MISFANREYFSFLIAVFVFFSVIQVFSFIRYKKAISILLTPRSQFLLLGYHPIKRILKLIILFFGFMFLLLAYLRPQFERDPVKITQEGWNVLIALDISRSMRSSDVQPSRLSAAKEKIKKLVKRLSCARVGLVLFSQDAFIQCPLTDDLDAFVLFLDPVDSEAFSGASTALDRALQVSLDGFKNIQDKNKIIVLLTDGEDFSHDLNLISEELKKQNVLLCALGIGTQEGAPVPRLDLQGNIIGYENGDDGHVIISRLNELVLTQLTQHLDGLYLRMAPNDSDIERIKKFIEIQKKGSFTDKEISMNFDLYPFFLCGGIVCLLLEWLF